MCGDVGPRELLEVRRIAEADLPGLVARGVVGHAVAQDAADHPERAHANRRRAVDEHRTVRGIVGNLQELVDRRVGRLLKVDRDVEVLQAGGLDGLLLLVGAMFARLPQVQHRLDAVRLQRREVFGARLPAGAEVGCNLQEVADVERGLRRWSLSEEQREENCDHGPFSQVPVTGFQCSGDREVTDPISTTFGAVDAYLLEHLLGADPVLDAALADSAAAGLPPINVPPTQGKLLYLLTRLQRAATILEIGTLAGYSTIWLARALPPHGRIIT